MKVGILRSVVTAGLLAVMGLAGGCAPVAAVGAGAAAGAAVAQEFGADVTPEDRALRQQIQDAWQQVDADMAARVSATVSQGRVLVTGRVANPDQRVQAVRSIWGVPGVVEVMNEVEIAEEAGLTQAARDGWIRAQLRSRLTVDSAIRAIDYSIDVVDEVVYLMGVARSEDERDRVVNNARQVPYVTRVVDYIRVRGAAESAA